MPSHRVLCAERITNGAPRMSRFTTSGLHRVSWHGRKIRERFTTEECAMSVDKSKTETNLSRRGFLACLTLVGAGAAAAAVLATGAEAAPDAGLAIKPV